MEETNLTKKLFSNYLRNLYIEMTPEELNWVKDSVKHISKNSWCAIITGTRILKGLLSYYLISRGCPEYRILTTSELIDLRFLDETSSFKDLIEFDGILILRYSEMFVHNKLTFESLMHVVSERIYKSKAIIVISDVAKDIGRDSNNYVYYDHSRVSECIGSSGIKSTPVKSSTKNKPSASPVRQSSHGSTNKPLANMRIARENSLESRVQSIEGEVKCNIE